MINAANKSSAEQFHSIKAAAMHACIHGHIQITPRLWEEIAGPGCPFDPDDYRLKELCWGLVFASAGMSKAVTIRAPGQQIIRYRMVYDSPSKLKTVIARVFLNRKREKIVILEAGKE